MAIYRRETRIDAPLSAVWAFHSRIEGLEALTPRFVNLRVNRIVGPDGERDPEVLTRGTRIHLSARPLGVLPEQSFVSVITDREEGDDHARFVDTMEDGPFPEWRHTHSFRADGDQTVLLDEVRYRLPGGRLGELAGPLGRLGFDPAFRYRHRRTKQLLENGDRPTLDEAP